MTKTAPARGGRPRKLDHASGITRFNMQVDGDFRDKLLRLRQAESDLPTEADMMRRLVDRAIAQLDKPAGTKR